MVRYFDSHSRMLAAILTAVLALYIAWKVTESPDQALQFAFNGLAVGAVYALLAIGFTIVYSTVWFFDLYYGAASALGAYGVFYLRSQDTLSGIYEVNVPLVNILFAVVTAAVVAWSLHEWLFPRLRDRISPLVLRVLIGIVALCLGGYMGLVLAFPGDMYMWLSPAVGVAVAVAIGWLISAGFRQLAGSGLYVLRLPVAAVAVGWLISHGSRLLIGGAMRWLRLGVAVVASVAVGAYCGLFVYGEPATNLYLSWATTCLLAGMVGMGLYRGLYVYMRERARSPLIMLVATLGILLAITAFITIVFSPSGRPLPDAFGSMPWRIAGANIKPFNVFAIGVAIVGFLAILWLVKWTAFGKAMRAIGDDEEVAKVVGINTTVIISVVFFIGAVYAAMAGILSGHDTAIQPRMGLLLLLKGWIASVVGGIGNLYGAIVGGFVLGIVEQFGIWDLAGEWKDAISFILLILFLSFWPNGLLPRK